MLGDNFSDSQEGWSVSSVIYEHWWYFKLLALFKYGFGKLRTVLCHLCGWGPV